MGIPAGPLGAFTRVWVAALLLALMAGCSPAENGPESAPGPVFEPKADAPPPLLLISIDGLRHDYLPRADTPVIDRLAREGLQADALIPVYPSKTFTNHYAIVTGLYTENHGVVANRMWDPARQARFTLGDADAVGDGRWFDGEPIWVTAERQGLTAATYFWPGSEAEIAGYRPTFWKRYNARVSHAERIATIVEWLDLPPAERPDFLTLYFHSVDAVGHRRGPDSDEVIEALEAVDADLSGLLAELEARALLGHMHILLVTDHGMAEIDSERRIYLDDYLPLDDVRISDLGPTAHIWAEDMPAEAVRDALQEAHPNLRVWLREEVPERYRFRDHPRIPDVVAEADLGWEIGDRRRGLAARAAQMLRGAHGWDPAYPEMHGIFIAHGPAFAPGSRMPAIEVVHLYELMAHLLELEPAPNDGSLAVFEDSLRQ